MRLDNQIAIVTGSGQGIGQQIAFRLAQEGGNVVMTDINEKGSLETAEIISKSYGRKAKIIPTDITSEEKVINLVLKLLDKFLSKL